MKVTIPLRALLKDYADTHYKTYPVPTDKGGCDEAIEEVELPEQIEIEIDLHAELAKHSQIAAIWSIEDVQQERPDLDEDQSWSVLQRVEHCHDCNYGITWEHLSMAADDLFPVATVKTTGQEG